MSNEYDKRRTIKLTPKNQKALDAINRSLDLPMSHAGFVNYVIEKFGIPGVKDIVRRFHAPFITDHKKPKGKP